MHNLEQVVKENTSSFCDPFFSGSICYTPMPREDLEKKLLENDLAVSGFSPSMGGLFQNYINSDLLDKVPIMSSLNSPVFDDMV